MSKTLLSSAAIATVLASLVWTTRAGSRPAAVTTPPLASLFQWEQSFFAFLRAELAPSPARWRNALRLTLLCVLGTTLVVSLHLPYGEFLIIFFFAVSQPDAWASLRKARLRGLGTVVGGALAVLIITFCGDKPWLFFVVQGLLLRPLRLSALIIVTV